MTDIFQQEYLIKWQRRLEQQRAWFPIVLLLLWPWILLLFVPNWVYFNNANLDDGWIYTGQFLNLSDYLKLYPEQGFYYITRLSWILPGYVAYHFLPPLAANLVLRLYVFYIAVFAIYGSLRYIHPRVGLLTALLLGGYSYFLLAAGWDYVDGAGIAYFALVIFLLLSAYQRSRRRLYFVLTGAVMALMLSVNLFTVSLLPAIIALFIANEYRNPRQFMLHGLMIVVGGIGLLILLGLSNVVLGGEFLFLRRSFLAASMIVGLKQNPWVAFAPDWPIRYGHMIWLELILFASMIALLAPRIYQRLMVLPYARFFIYIYILSAVVFIFWQLRSATPVLRVVFYASYLIGPLFLAIGALIAPAVIALSRRAYVSLLILALCVSLVGPLSRACEKVTPTIVVFGLAIGVGWIVLFMLAPTKVWQLALFVVVLGFAGPSAYSDIGSLTTCQVVAAKDQARNAYLATMDTHDAIQSLAPGQRVYFWYNGDENPLYQDIACLYLWVWNLVDEDFPQAKQIPEQATTILLLSERVDALEQAKNVLKAQGRRFDFVGQRVIQRGAISFSAYMFAMR